MHVCMCLRVCVCLGRGVVYDTALPLGFLKLCIFYTQHSPVISILALSVQKYAHTNYFVYMQHFTQMDL